MNILQCGFLKKKLLGSPKAEVMATIDKNINAAGNSRSTIDRNGDRVPDVIIRDAASSYFGGKGGAGVYQTIINLIPPHETYIETHLGGGAIMRHKKPAPRLNIGIDIDPEVTEMFNQPGTTVINEDATRFLNRTSFNGHEFVYSDPPYLMETRKSGKQYNFEYTTAQHVELIEVLKSLPCMVMVSGYYSDLYAEMLNRWNSQCFEAQTRHGKATEWVWYNYPKPKELHDYKYLGTNFRERERIKRKRQRWINRLLKMPIMERNSIIEAIAAAIAQNDDHHPGPIVKDDDGRSGPHHQKRRSGTCRYPITRKGEHRSTGTPSTKLALGTGNHRQE